ncbi:hypothetical protein HWC53_gp084 [Bacillus phage vB_BmeM-Goe8]|uniref:Uncharacterized protein n=1 Tax=Bacillus phage vB_BmeM-Goe8 TaxID=2593638 RepID=A0A516KN52_9CAUD|nr:hypothetical protein HWC53_gp084 [Bacillus phage vB_BmeM-Goe8]QDP43005.1 hypothetical protein Goe8_c02320 [Bacillus phage vB_BmeM-Goe8]
MTDSYVVRTIVGITKDAKTKEEAVIEAMKFLAGSYYVVDASADIYSEDDLNDNDELSEEALERLADRITKGESK